MPIDPAETLREVNVYLRRMLVRFHPERRHCFTIAPQDFVAILDQLLRSASSRNSLESTPEFEQELLDYRDNLEELRRLLPDLQGRLLAERARLESARSQLAAAVVWADASKTTL